MDRNNGRQTAQEAPAADAQPAQRDLTVKGAIITLLARTSALEQKLADSLVSLQADLATVQSNVGASMPQERCQARSTR